MSFAFRSVAVVAIYAIVSQWLPGQACANEPEQQTSDGELAEVQQVVIRARLVEIDRKKMRKLGCDYAIAPGDQSKVVEKGTGQTKAVEQLFGRDGANVVVESPQELCHQLFEPSR